jgi:hypothetical protein
VVTARTKTANRTTVRSKQNERPIATLDSPLFPVGRPEIIVDFLADQALLYVVLKNIGARSAYRVITNFDKSFQGLGGKKCISTLQLFRYLLFIPPGKEFVQLVDSLGAYFRRREPIRLSASITYEDREGQEFEDVISHDLRIYRDLGFISKTSLRSES